MSDPSTQVAVGPTLSLELAEAVARLAANAAEADGAAALSEASRLALGPDSPGGTRHVVARVEDRISGYAQVWPDGSAELVVAPDERRRGVGRLLWEQAHAEGAQRVWAHGDLPAAQAFAAAQGLAATRSLLKMGRPLTEQDRSSRPLPPGYAVTSFAERAKSASDPVGELRALNAAAFADHPEQGRLTAADLRTRMAESWFDPEGLIYVVDTGSGTAGAPPIAFHWTKIDGDPDGSARTGEVYVVGVSPAYQGRGLAGPLTDLGLAHLVSRGCTDVELYVDGANTPARQTYQRAGLQVLSTDRVYAPASAGQSGPSDAGRTSGADPA